ncbi:pilus assembly protein PilP [Neisseriaceae bacterium ESL0693]|nr:pilus assembly protein PilP [Neisseriaceae bacterium ESL0693]
MNKIVLLLCGLGLVACSGPNEDLQKWMQNASQKTKGHKIQAQKTELVLHSSYTPPPQPALNAFDPARLRMGAQGRNAPNLKRPKQTLENFNVESLHYVGQITSKGKSPSAFIEADGHVYTVGIGNYIGQDYGRITAITPNEIIFTEQVEDSSGDWTDRRNTLSLQVNGDK